MENYREYLQEITSIINRARLPVAEEQILDRLVEKIKIRTRDQNCYLAVIGEFSSGKSTLVNAFLKDNLLPTSVLVTTATETRIRTGNSLELTAFFHQEYKLPLKPSIDHQPVIPKHKNWWERLIAFLRKFLGISIHTIKPVRARPKYQSKKIINTQDLADAGIEMRSFINNLAADEDIAQHLDYIEIKHPSNFLQDGVVIIDLPGSNAPNDRHFKVTQSVVENEADAAIIIIPATQPLTQSSIQFIKQNLSQYIDKCIFIITMLDRVREKEREVVIKSVSSRLQELFKVKNSSIYSCSAQLALDYYMGELGSEQDGDYWLKQFSLMENALIKRLKIEREKLIVNSIMRLLDRLLQQLSLNLTARSNEYQARKSALEAELVRDFQAFTKDREQIYQQRITNVVSRNIQKVPDWVSSQTIHTYNRVKNTIFAANSWDELKDVLENRLVVLLNAGKDEIANNIKDRCNLIQEEVYHVSQEFDLSFQQAYQRLNVLGGQVNINSFGNAKEIKIDTYAVLASAKEMNQNNFGNTMKGLFSHVFKGLIAERKKQVWNLMQTNLEREFKRLETVATASIFNYGEQAKQALNIRILSYLSAYQEQINILIQSQQRELMELQNFQQQTESDLLQIKKMQTIINV
jgi:GTPase Era involved in 16S rRNA processing